MTNIYRTAWKLLRDRIEDKTSWGKNELASLMSQCMEEAVEELEKDK